MIRNASPFAVAVLVLGCTVRAQYPPGEHNRNAPNNDYFLPGIFPAFPVPYNSTGLWNFMTSGGSRTGALVPKMSVDPNTGKVNASSGNAVRPNNVYRVNPWGSPPAPASVSNNGQLVSLNKDISFMLNTVASKDVRANYTQIGAAWTNNGSIPNSPTDKANQRGSLGPAI